MPIKRNDMKKITITLLLSLAVITAKSQTNCPAATEPQPSPATQTVSDIKTGGGDQTPAVKKAEEHSTAASSLHTIIYVGTNEFYLSLVREGVNKA
jgi:hypothetical protein